jgi:hypothetical protein
MKLSTFVVDFVRENRSDLGWRAELPYHCSDDCIPSAAGSSKKMRLDVV